MKLENVRLDWVNNIEIHKNRENKNILKTFRMLTFNFTCCTILNKLLISVCFNSFKLIKVLTLIPNVNRKNIEEVMTTKSQ